MFRRILKGQRGAFMVFFAILVPLFIGMIGFAVDAGFIYMQKAKMQDIADAAALAGAARLNDGEDKEGHVTSAVRAYAEANGLSGVATAMASLDESSDLPTKYDKLKILQGIQYNVTDKDGKQRDHVKVVIAKRVPTFFINVLFPDQKDGVVVKVAAAAEYVEGEEVPVSYGGPKVICARYNFQYKSGASIDLKEGEDFSMYIGSELSSGYGYDRLPILKNSNSVLFQPHGDDNLPEGWSLIRTTQDTWDLNDPKQVAQKEALEKATDFIDSKKREYSNKVNQLLADKQSYINSASGSSKRYIGPDSNGNIINTIKDSDDNIDLYMDATSVKIDEEWENGKYYKSILTNSQLKNVKKINTLIFGKDVFCDPYASWKTNIISTNGITYGNIYNTFIAGGLSISGKNNHFNGIIYTPGTLMIGGIDNWFNESGNCQLFALSDNNGQIEIGHWQKVIEDSTTGGSIIKSYSDIYENNNSAWKIHWGGTGSSSGSGSSGSDDSGDETKAHVRLVE